MEETITAKWFQSRRSMPDATTTEELLKVIGSLEVETKWTRLCAVQPERNETDWGRWTTQYEASAFIEAYLRKDKADHEKAALVRMPTGSGKTGIMALAANYFNRHFDHGSCLIVVPSKYLTDQVARAINGEYWRVVRKRPREPIPAVVFLPSTINRRIARCSGPVVLVCTQKTLSDIHSKEPEKYSRLAERIGAVFVDEGHREPAITWAKAVRSFKKPTVLFSATPYRNDLRMFHIGRAKNGYRYKLTYLNAQAIGLVRKIRLEHPKRSFCTRKRDENIFSRELMRFYENVLLSHKPASVHTPRVIVRCDSQDYVERVQEALIRAVPRSLKQVLGYGSIIGIHEEFRKKEAEWRFTHPPAPGARGSSAVFWVHQFKLVEGIDNNEFCCVAFFEPFNNARSLVQQIGRIVRNPSGAEEIGFVFSDKNDRLDRQWSGYMSFEEADQDIIGAEDIVETIREAQPKWFYADRKYRQGVDFDAEDYWDDIRVPATTQVYLRPDGYGLESLHQLALQIEEQLELRDIVRCKMLPIALGKERFCMTTLYWKIFQSSHFFERGSFDVALLVSHLYMNGKYIFYQGLVTLETACGPQSPEKIEVDNLLSALPSGDSQLKELSLINSDMGNMAVRRRSMGGRSLEFASVALNDHLHFVTSCTCSQNAGRRYIGLSNARITDIQSQYMALKEYHKWLDELTTILTSSREHKDTPLRRFAPAIRKPVSAKAKHLLLDLKEFTNVYDHTSPIAQEQDGEVFEATACEVEDDGSFQCAIRGEIFRGNISYKHGRFVITSDEFNELWKRKDNVKRSAVSFLASNTVMRVVTEAGQIYADGRFYSTMRLRGRHRFTDLDIFAAIPALGNVTKKEKGNTGVVEGNTWQQGSIFQIIDNDAAVFSGGRIIPNILVCDDSSGEHYELADFVAIQMGDRKGIALLHAKNGSGNGSLSVGNLHEVVSQAKKNLGVFDPSEDLPLDLARKWNGFWTTGREQLSRIRRPTDTLRGEKIVTELDQLRSNPATEKEVWLVLGNMFGKKEITEVIMSSGNVEYHWIQMLYLLHSLHASVTAIGAKLRVLVGS